MFGYPKWRAWTIIVVAIIAIFFAIPNFIPTATYKTSVPKSMQAWWRPMPLGLDLKGGSSLLLEIKSEDLINEHLNSLSDNVRTILREARMTFSRPVVENGVLTVKIKKGDPSSASAQISKLDNGLDISVDGDTLSIAYTDQAVQSMLSDAISQSIEIVRNRVDETGTTEPSIQKQGTSRIQLQIPGVQDPRAIKERLGKTAKLTFHLEDDTVSYADIRRGKKVPMDSMLIENGDAAPIVVKRAVIVGGDQLDKVKVEDDTNGRPAVGFKFKTLGAKNFSKVTRENVGRRLAIILDNEAISAPVINSHIPGGAGIITGNFTFEEASTLVLLLRSGALPAPLTVVEERVVGAGLGSDSIRAGAFACIIGAVLVFAFMLFVYGRFGLFANIALCINIFLLFAILSLLNATLTLPGLAGIVLTIGMAVDANVLIFARMKEEAQLGRSPLQIINAGFANSFTAIVDSQITTLFAAVVLFFFGTGPIRGFSVTLGLGVLTSLFTAVLVTKFLILIWYHFKKPTTLKI